LHRLEHKDGILGRRRRLCLTRTRNSDEQDSKKTQREQTLSHRRRSPIVGNPSWSIGPHPEDLLTYGPMDLLHPDLCALPADDAGLAARIHGLADILPPGHQIQIDLGPEPARHHAIERLLGLIRHSSVDPAETIGDAVDVRIHADVALA